MGQMSCLTKIAQARGLELSMLPGVADVDQAFVTTISGHLSNMNGNKEKCRLSLGGGGRHSLSYQFRGHQRTV